MVRLGRPISCVQEGGGGKGVTPSNILKRLFLCLDTSKSTKEWYQVECEQVVKNPKLVFERVCL